MSETGKATVQPAVTTKEDGGHPMPPGVTEITGMEITDANPASEVISSEGATEDLVGAFRADLEGPIGSRESGRTYSRYVRRFLTFAIERKWTDGSDLSALPQDSVEQFFDAQALPVGTRNVAIGSLKAFQRWCISRGIPFAAVDYPATVKVKRKRKVAQPELEPETDWWSPQMGIGNGAAVPAPAASEVAPTEPEVGLAETSTPQNTPPDAPRAPVNDVPAASAPQPVPPSPSASQPSQVRSAQRMAPPRPITRRETANRNPIAALMPVLGKIRILRQTTGAEGLPAGKAQLIGEYSAAEVQRHGDFVSFIHSAIRPAYGPRPGEPGTTYIIEPLDEYGRPGPATEVNVAAPLLGAAGPGVPHYQQSQPVITGRAERESALESTVIQLLQKEREQAEKRATEMTNQLMTMIKGSGASIDPAMLMLIAQNNKPTPIDVNAVIAQAKAAVGMDRPAPPPPPPVVVPPPRSFGGIESDESGLLKTIVEKMFDANRPQIDPMTQMLTVMKFFKEIGGSNEQDRIRELKDEIRDMRASLNGKNTDLMARVNEIMALKRLSEELGGGSNSPGIGELILDNVKEIGEAFTSIFSTFMKAAPSVAQLQETNRRLGLPAPQPEQAPPQRPAVPAEATNALLALRDAPVADEQATINALFALIKALGSTADPYWQDVTQKITEALKAARNKADLRVLVSNTIIVAGGRTLLNDTLVDKVVTVVHKYYSGLSKMLWDTPKILEDAAKAPSEGVTTPATATTSDAATNPAADALNESADGRSGGNDRGGDEADDDDDDAEEGEENDE